jgi:bifunctional NMN adenylyltransferase/nudix hydrolase
MSHSLEGVVGVIVARFQVPELHEGHRYLMDYVLKRHAEVLVILGVAAAVTDRNPLTYEMRKQMVESMYPNRAITFTSSDSLPSSYDERSQRIDAIIRAAFPGRKAIIYGSRDSFIHTYRGEFDRHEVPTIYSGSASKIRQDVPVINSPDFRSGVIFAMKSARRPLSYPTVDVAVVRPDLEQVLLVGKRDEEGELRFPGVFFNHDTDTSFEQAALRCVAKEVPTIVIAKPSIVGSSQIADWRYRKSRHGIVTLLVRAEFVRGEPVPGEGVTTVHWVKFEDVPDVLVRYHLPLADLMSGRWLS